MATWAEFAAGRAEVLEADAGGVPRWLPLKVMPWAKTEHELLVEFDLERAGWTTWLDFMTVNHRPRHHRWREPR